MKDSSDILQDIRDLLLLQLSVNARRVIPVEQPLPAHLSEADVTRETKAGWPHESGKQGMQSPASQTSEAASPNTPHKFLTMHLQQQLAQQMLTRLA